MTHEQIDRALSLAERYVVVQEHTLALSVERVRAMALNDEQMTIIREREAAAAEKQANKVIEIKGDMTGNMRQTIVRGLGE